MNRRDYSKSLNLGGVVEREKYDNLLNSHLEKVNERIEEAYMAGLMHGINVSSMARVKRNVMEFEDYEWTTPE